MNEKPKHRWYQFRLRTFLAGIAVAAVWFGWQADIVKDRKAMLALIAARGGWHHTDRTVIWGEYRTGFVAKARALLGDVPIPLIVLPNSMKTQRADVHDVFPEVLLIRETNGRFCAPPPEH